MSEICQTPGCDMSIGPESEYCEKCSMLRQIKVLAARVRELEAARAGVLGECQRLENLASSRLAYQDMRGAQDYLCEMSAIIRAEIRQKGNDEQGNH